MKNFALAFTIGCLTAFGATASMAQSGPVDGKGQTGGTSNTGTNPNSSGISTPDGAKGDMKGSSGSNEMTRAKPPVEGVAGAPTPQMGDHHQPTTGAGK